MKILLMVLTVFTLPLAQAQTEDAVWFEVKSRECATGAVYKEPAEAKTPFGERIQLAEDMKSAKVIDAAGNESQFTLTLQGKNTYLATPSQVSENPQHFFVKKTDEGVTIYNSDWMAERCSGGLVVTSLVRF